MLRFANTLAWAAIVVLIAVAILVANRLGFAGLLVLGLLTAFVCGHAELQDDIPAAGTAIFKARMERGRSPEERHAKAEEGRSFISSLRFFKWCGVGLAMIGLIGFVLQLWITGA
jgi:UPF0716 family protein affecting phage T7 exclusion